MTKIASIILKYPVRNNKWILVQNRFSCEHSSMNNVELNQILDPWNRRFPDLPIAYRDRENDITHWVFTTSVKGINIECWVFND